MPLHHHNQHRHRHQQCINGTTDLHRTFATVAQCLCIYETNTRTSYGARFHSMFITFPASDSGTLLYWKLLQLIARLNTTTTTTTATTTSVHGLCSTFTPRKARICKDHSQIVGAGLVYQLNAFLTPTHQHQH